MIENNKPTHELKDEYGNPIEFARDDIIGDHLLDVKGYGNQNKYGVADKEYYNQYSNRFV